MTNTKFRKRALLSSVAMLLVALVALGSATFAWYQATLSVTATGMTLKTTAGAGLLVATETGKVASVLQFSTAATMTRDATTVIPISVKHDDETENHLPKYFTADGKLGTDGDYNEGRVTDVTSTIATLSDTAYAVSDKIYFKQTAGTAVTGDNAKVWLTGVKLTLNDDGNEAQTMTSAIRVLVLDKDGKVLGEFASAAANDAEYFTTSGASSVATASDKTLKAWGANLGANAIYTGLNAGTSVPSDGITVRVYLDGFDDNVTSNNAQAVGASAELILEELELTFKMGASA